MEKLLREFSDTITLKLNARNLSYIESLQIHLKPDAVSVRSKQHRYPQPQPEFMTLYVRELLKLGFVKHSNAKTVDHVRASQLLDISILQDALNEMHKDVDKLVSKRREQAITKQNAATNIISPAFAVGYFVLVRRANDRGHKLHFKWFGHWRISAVHRRLVHSFTSLSSNKTERVHCARLLKYDDSLHNCAVSRDHLDMAERTESRYDFIDKIVDLADSPNSLLLQVV